MTLPGRISKAAVVGLAAGAVFGAAASAAPARAAERPPIAVESVAGAYLAGGHAAATGDPAAAASFYARALEADPTDTDLVREVFRARMRAGALDDALAQARRLAEASPEEPAARALLVVEAARTGDFAAALDLLDGVERTGVAALTAPLVEAWLRLGAGEGEDALAALDPLRARGGLAGITGVHEGLMLEWLGRPDGARAAFEAGLAEGRPTRLVQALVRLNLRRGQVDAARALLAGDDEAAAPDPMLAAERAALEAGETLPPLIGDPADGIAEALYQIADILAGEGAVDLALLHAHYALHLRPDLIPARIELGDILLAAGRFAAALEAYRAVAGAGPTAWPARLREAEALRALDRTADAEALLSALAEGRPERTEPLIALGDLRRSDSRFEAAVEAYDAAFERDPDRLAADWRFLYRRGIALERSGDWQRAEADLTRAIAIEPDEPHLLNYLGYSWIDRGENLAEGEELIRRAVERLPEDGYIVDSLGWAYYRTGRIGRAVETLERAVELRPADAVINDHLGDAYWMAGREREARFQWRRALSLAGEDETDLVLEVEGKLANGLTDPGILEDAVTRNAAEE